PFGEYIPLVGRVRWIRERFARAEGFTPGTRPALVSVRAGAQTLTLGVLNCFEDTMAVVGAGLARADLLVNITNDAWFGDGAAPWQHLMLARWRAVETRRELVRAVNTGVTCHVDALGRVERHAPTWRTETLVVAPRRMSLAPVAPSAILG